MEKRVLLVEDDAPLRRSLENFLGRAGYTFDSCVNARDALKLAEAHLHDIVIAEYHLPDSNGSALLEKLKLVVPHVATIILSQYDFRAIADDLARVEVRSFLKKPFDLVELEAALSSAGSKVKTPNDSVVEGRQSLSPGVPASGFGLGNSQKLKLKLDSYGISSGFPSWCGCSSLLLLMW